MNKIIVNTILVLSTVIICFMGLYIFIEERLFYIKMISDLYVLKILIPFIIISHLGICTGLWYLINNKKKKS